MFGDEVDCGRWRDTQPFDGVGRVDRVENSIDAFMRDSVGHFEEDVVRPKFLLGADEAFGQSCLRQRERRGDVLGLCSDDDLQDEWRVNGAVQRWVDAGEHQHQSVIVPVRVKVDAGMRVGCVERTSTGAFG